MQRRFDTDRIFNRSRFKMFETLMMFIRIKSTLRKSTKQFFFVSNADNIIILQLSIILQLLLFQ